MNTVSCKDSSTDLCVTYTRHIPHAGFTLNEQFVRAKYVILGAGSIGSTKILLKSKRLGLDISDRLGKFFSSNGDVFGVCYNAKKRLNAIGVASSKEMDSLSPGPTIVSAIDLRGLPNNYDMKNCMVIQVATPPVSARTPYSLTMAMASTLIGVKTTSDPEKIDAAMEV